jgi:hypothetical protein
MPDSPERPEQCSGLSLFLAVKTHGEDEDSGVVSYARACGVAQSGG